MEKAKESMAPRMAAKIQTTPIKPSRIVSPKNSPNRIRVYFSQTFRIALVYVWLLVRVKA